MKKLLLTLALLLSILSSQAQRIAGSEIYYKRTGNRQYTITAIVYRECDSDPLTSLSGYVIAGTKSLNLPFTRISIQKINDTCSKPCNIVNDYSNPGFEKHTFISTVNFNDVSYQMFLSDCIVNFAIKQSGRDSRTTTQSSGLYYNEASVNICDSLIPNSSPIFSIEPKFKVANNFPLVYSPGPLDTTDYDSMVFELVPALVDHNKYLGYNAGYTQYIPLTPYCPPNPGVTNCRPLPNAKPPRGFYFDYEYCNIIFTPTVSGEMSYVRIRISEYRRVNNQIKYLGSIYREMLVSVESMLNNNPSYFNSNTSSNTINVCSNAVNFTIQAKDEIFLPQQTNPDTSVIFYNNGIKNATSSFDKSSNEESLILSLPLDTDSKRRTQFFSVAAYDKLCNENLISKTFKVYNYPKTNFKKSYTIDSCNNLNVKVSSLDTNTQLIGNTSIQTPSGLTKLHTNNFALNENGQYVIIYNFGGINSQCLSLQYDTFKINNAFLLPVLNITKDSNVCSSAPLTLNFNPSKINNLTNLYWYKNDTLINSTDSIINTIIYNNSSITLILKNNAGCTSITKRQFNTIKKKYQLFTDTVLNFCPHDSQIISTNDYFLKPPTVYKWTYMGDSFNGLSSIQKIKIPGTKSSEQLKLKVEDDNHCQFSDSILINTFQSPRFTIGKDKIPTCLDSTVEFRIDGLVNDKVKTIRWKREGVNWFSNVMKIDWKIYQNNNFYVSVLDSNNCFYEDTLKIVAIKNPKIESISISSVCEDDTTMAKLNLNKGYVPNIIWEFDKKQVHSNDTFIKFPAKTSGILKVSVNNNNTCYSSSSYNFTVYPKPVFKIIGDSIYHYSNKIILSVDNRNWYSYIWKNSYFGLTNSFWANELGPPGIYKYWLDVQSYYGCTSSDTITLITNTKTQLSDITSDKVQLYPNPAHDQLLINNLELNTYTIQTLEGKTVHEGILITGAQSIDIRTLAPGIYVFQSGINRIKFVKE